MYGGVETLAQHTHLGNRQGYIAMHFFLFWLMEDSGAGGRAYWVWSIGEGWVFIFACDSSVTRSAVLMEGGEKA